MKLVGVRIGGKSFLWEKDDGMAVVVMRDLAIPGDEVVETDVSVQAVLARGYWRDPTPEELQEPLPMETEE